MVFFRLSILPTFYAPLFPTKVSREDFLYLDLRFVLFSRKNNGTKAARNVLVKLKPYGRRNFLAFFSSSQME
jgi:hypothetical protein